MRKLEGKVVAITRPLERSEEAANIIKEEGGIPLVTPTLELRMTCTESLIKLCENASQLDWIIFTSPASLESLFTYCSDFKDRLNPECMVAAIGPRTARAVQDHGLPADLMPDNYTAEGLLGVMKDYELEGKIIGIPRTFSARNVLNEGLRKMGGQVLLAEAYESTLPTDQEPAQSLIEGIINGKIDAVTFTSPLTVHNLIEMSETKRDTLLKALREEDILVVAIGPITGAAIDEYDIKYVSPSKYTVNDMLDKLIEEMT
jgi:uroporphyrinogen-III synthase